jgi:mannose-6-phosphate isomerase-like protein (cupin superfamily)
MTLPHPTMRINLPSKRQYPHIVEREQANMGRTDYRTNQIDQESTHSEDAAFPGLTVVNLKQQADSIDQTYKNFVVVNINNHCVRLAVMQGEFRWHQHPRSDECFLVVEGDLEIDLAGGRTFRLKPGEIFTIPAGVVHRTRSHARAVNLCFEDRNAYTDVVFEDSERASK